MGSTHACTHTHKAGSESPLEGGGSKREPLPHLTFCLLSILPCLSCWDMEPAAICWARLESELESPPKEELLITWAGLIGTVTPSTKYFIFSKTSDSSGFATIQPPAKLKSQQTHPPIPVDTPPGAWTEKIWYVGSAEFHSVKSKMFSSVENRLEPEIVMGTKTDSEGQHHISSFICRTRSIKKPRKQEGKY